MCVNPLCTSRMHTKPSVQSLGKSVRASVVVVGIQTQEKVMCLVVISELMTSLLLAQTTTTTTTRSMRKRTVWLWRRRKRSRCS